MAVPIASFGVSLVGVQSNFDAFGRLLTVTYNGTTQTVEAEFNVPVATRRFERTEPSNPEAKARIFIGTVNILPWLGSAPATYLCKAITGDPVALENGAIAWRVAYEFESSAEQTWDPLLVYTDEETGKPPADATLGNGIAQAVLYRATDFNLLNLSYI